VLGLIDEVAEKSEFYPVYPKKTPREKKPVKRAEKRPARDRKGTENDSKLDGLELEGAEPSPG
jgi:hypothetical protein